MTTEAERIEAILAEHMHEGYFETKDGHRECFCGHVMAEGERYRAHLAAALVAAETGGGGERAAYERGVYDARDAIRHATQGVPHYQYSLPSEISALDELAVERNPYPDAGGLAERMRELAAQWNEDVKGYPHSEVGNFSKAAVISCKKEMLALLAQPAPSDAMDQAIAESPTLKESP